MSASITTENTATLPFTAAPLGASTASSTSGSASASASSSSFPPPGNGGVSSSLYLFTFLITILVLAMISGALLGRAFFVRRRFQRRVEEAIRSGQPLPHDAAAALGLIQPERRGKKEKKVGPMPAMWESEMLLNHRRSEDTDLEKGWGDIHPLSVLHFPDGNNPPPPENTFVTFDGPLPRTRFFGLISTQPFPRPQFERGETNMSLRARSNITEVPPAGTEVSVGVMIALPFQAGSPEADLWHPPTGDDEEANVPQVVLGVMGCTLAEESRSAR